MSEDTKSPPPQANQALWATALEQLKTQMTQATFETWVKDSSLLSVDGQRYTIGVKSAFAKDWLEHRLYTIIQRTLAGATGQPELELNLVVVGNGADPPAADSQPPQPIETPVGVELVTFDPTLRGFVMVANYAARFWQPYLRRFGSPACPFALWVTLKAFAYDADREAWPSIQTLADICGDGQRYKILGRAERKNCKRIVGALELLEQQRIVYTRTEGKKKPRYFFRVLEHLPLLTPRQIEQLSSPLQKAHQRWLKQCEIDYEEWEQLTLPSLTTRE